MKSFLMALLSDSGEVSAGRVMALASLSAGIALGFIGVLNGKDLSGLAQVVAVYVTSAFAAKTLAKYAEK